MPSRSAMLWSMSIIDLRIVDLQVAAHVDAGPGSLLQPRFQLAGPFEELVEIAALQGVLVLGLAQARRRASGSAPAA